MCHADAPLRELYPRRGEENRSFPSEALSVFSSVEFQLLLAGRCSPFSRVFFYGKHRKIFSLFTFSLTYNTDAVSISCYGNPQNRIALTFVDSLTEFPRIDSLVSALEATSRTCNY